MIYVDARTHAVRPTPLERVAALLLLAPLTLAPAAGAGEPPGCVPHWDLAAGAALNLQPVQNYDGIYAMAVFDDGLGDGPVLFVGGEFTADINGTPTYVHVARWNGTSWSDAGSAGSPVLPATSVVTSLKVFDDGGGPQLWCGTRPFGGNIGAVAKYHPPTQGSSAFWQPVTPFANGITCIDIEIHDDGDGPALYFIGYLPQNGSGLYKWQGGSWTYLNGSGLGGGAFDAYYDLHSWQGSLYLCGGLTHLDHLPVNRVARWDGPARGWSSMGNPANPGLNQVAFAMTDYDDGTGSALYIAGGFTQTVDGSLSLPKIVKWNGATFAQITDDFLDIDVDDSVLGGIRALAVFDDDDLGDELYLGAVSAVNSVPMNGVAKWNGTAWSSLDLGLAGTCCPGVPPFVARMLAVDAPSLIGPTLFVSGNFTEINGQPANSPIEWTKCLLPGTPGPRFWTNPTGGVFNDVDNWQPGAVPGPVNSAVFELNSASPYTVSFTKPPEDTRQILSTHGSVVLDLDGHTWSLIAETDPALLVGELAEDDASVVVMNGVLKATSAEIGSGSGSVGVLDVTGSATTLLAQNSLHVGNFGTGTLNVTDGGEVLSLFAFVGQGPGASGSVTLAGTGSSWSVPFFLFVNNGQVTVNEGTQLNVGFGLFLSKNATVSGGGTIDADVINFGTIAPGPDGTDPGGLTIGGSYEQVGQQLGFGPNTGSLTIDVKSMEHDMLAVSGPATLAGGLFVDFVGGFEPQVGESFPFLDAGQVSDQFDVAFFRGLPQGSFAKLTDTFGFGGGEGLSVTIDRLGSIIRLGDPTSVGLDAVPAGVALADFDGVNGIDLAIALPDADPENNGVVLVLLNAGVDGLGEWLGFGDQLSVTVGRNPSGVVVGDFDGDAQAGIDLAVTNRGDDTVSLRFNLGGGVFGNAAEFDVGSQPAGIAAGRFNDDGAPDLAIASAADGTVEVYHNVGGAFTRSQTIPTGPIPGDINPFDIDDDDKCIDICLPLSASRLGGPGSGGAVAVLVNMAGVFQPPILLPVGDQPVDAHTADLDADGNDDIVAVNQGSGTVSVLLGDGDGGFLPGVQLPVGAAPRSIASLDLELDGDIDLAVVTGSDESGEPIVQVLRNDLNAGTQLVFADAEELMVGDMPIFVVAGDLDQDAVDDLVTVNEGLGGVAGDGDAGGGGGGAPGAVNFLVNQHFVRPPPKPCDLNGDDGIDGADLGIVLGSWGPCQTVPCAADLNDDGFVNGADLGILLGCWG